MNYLKHYIKLCRKCQSRTIDSNIYYEKHHIFPISIFGKNKSVVKMTCKEHYMAHILLYKTYKKRYGLDHIFTKKMANAVMRMTCSSRFTNRTFPSRYYDQARNIWKKHWKNPMLDIDNRMYGADNPMYNIGKNHPLYGKSMTESTKKKISIANKGRLLGDKNPSKREDVKKKISIANRGGKTAHHGKNHPNFNHSISIEDREKLKIEWSEVKNTQSLYSFSKRYSQIYNCTMSGIQSIVYRSS